jgi:iron complex transport system substrate-binding protein
LKQSYIVLTVVLAAVIISVSAYGAYNFLSPTEPSTSPTPSATSTPTPTQAPTTTATPSSSVSPSATPTSTTEPTSTPTNNPTPTPRPSSVTVVDSRGENVTIALPVNRIVCMEAGVAEIICALGGEDKIVGRLGESNWPKSVNSKPSIGSSSQSTNMEAVLDLNPDLIIASDSILKQADTMEKIGLANITLYIDNSNLPTRVDTIVSNFGLILDNELKAEQINNNTRYYTNLVQTRIQNATPTRFIATAGLGWTCWGINSKVAALMVSCGGVNLFANNSGSITPEAAAELNPTVLICQAASITNNVTIFESTRNEYMTRAAYLESDAVKNGRVYVYNYWLSGGIEYPAGMLYFAKWLHPDLFTDIDPGAIYVQLIQEYFGVTPDGVYGYP